jgi:hypothetical protein
MINSTGTVLLKLTDISDMITASIMREINIITLMVKAVRTFEMSVNFNETAQRNIPEGFHLHICHHKNLKSLLE